MWAYPPNLKNDLDKNKHQSHVCKPIFGLAEYAVGAFVFCRLLTEYNS